MERHFMLVRGPCTRRKESHTRMSLAYLFLPLALARCRIENLVWQSGTDPSRLERVKFSGAQLE